MVDSNRDSFPADHELEMPAPVRVVDEDHYVGHDGRIRRLGPKYAAAGVRQAAP